MVEILYVLRTKMYKANHIYIYISNKSIQKPNLLLILVFQDATLFDFDYLSKIGKGKPSRRLVRESLFLKFDPLAAAAAAVATPEPAQEMAQADR